MFLWFIRTFCGNCLLSPKLHDRSCQFMGQFFEINMPRVSNLFDCKFTRSGGPEKMSNKRIASQLNWNLQSSIEQLWKRRNLAGNHRQCCAIVGYLETLLWNNPPTSAFKFNKSAKHLPPSGHWIVSQNSRFCEIYEHLFRKIFESRLQSRPVSVPFSAWVTFGGAFSAYFWCRNARRPGTSREISFPASTDNV